MHVHERARCLAQYLTGQLIKADLADSDVLQHLQHLLHGHDEVDVNVPALVLQDNVGGSGSHDGGGADMLARTTVLMLAAMVLLVRTLILAPVLPV